MHIAVVGAGALGLYYGGRIQHAGASTGARVTFLARSDYEALRERGLIVHSREGDFHLPDVAIVKDPAEFQEVDVVLIGLKTTANALYKELVGPIVAANQNTALLSLQNGIGNEPLLAELFPAQAIIGGTAFLCSNRVGPAEISHTHFGGVAIAGYQEVTQDRLTTLCDLFKNSKVPCAIADDYHAMRWRKQLWNVPFNGLCTLMNAPTDQVLAQAKGEARVRAIILEVLTLARALHTERSGSKMQADFGPLLIEDQIQKTKDMGDYHPSMLLDYRAGRELELESIIGACIAENDALTKPVEIPEIRSMYAELQRLVGLA